MNDKTVMNFLKECSKDLDNTLSTTEKKVCHYTDSETHKKITISSELHLNKHCNVRNDPKEYKFANEIIIKFLSENIKRKQISKEKCLHALNEFFKKTTIYLACFSEENNEYCKEEYGRKILSFSSNEIVPGELIPDSVGLFSKVEYFKNYCDFKNNDKSHIKKYLDTVIRYFNANGEDENIGLFAYFLYIVTPLMKNIEYINDKEIRLCFYEIEFSQVETEKHYWRIDSRYKKEYIALPLVRGDSVDSFRFELGIKSWHWTSRYFYDKNNKL